MKGFDEYQQFRRHRNGYNAFLLIWILILINSFIFRVTGSSWGETREVEYAVILLFSAIYFNVSNAWQGTYFRKWGQPKWINLPLLLFGIAYVSAFSIISDSPDEWISEGKVTMTAVLLLAGLVLLSTPVTYFLKYFIDKKGKEI